MPASVVQSHNSASTASTSVTLTSCTVGNYIGVFFCELVASTTPSISDNINGSTGWTREVLTATMSTGAVFYFHRIAAGGEATFTVTPGTGATGEGLSAVEVSGLGASPTVNASANSNDTGATVATKATGAITTTDSGAIILACVGQNSASGTVSAWNNSMNNATLTGTASTRSILGTLVPGTTVSAQTYTATWLNANRVGALVFAIAPTAAGGTTVKSLSALGVG